MASSMDEREVFTRRYDGVEPAGLWRAVKRALATMDLRRSDDEERMAQFSTGTSQTSWGQNMLATVTARGAEGSTLTVRGRPKQSFMTTKWGEGIHARSVEKQIVAAVESELRSTATT